MENKYIIIILIFNIITFLIMGYDKYKAMHNKYRVKESILLIMGLIVGAFGSILGMIFFHHKTKKLYFKIVFFLEIIINLVFIYFLLNYI